MIFMAKKPVWRKLLPMGLLIAAAVAVGVTGATVLHTMSLDNYIKTPPVEGHIEEKIEGTCKNAYFVNDGEADVFLRVAYSESWLYKVEGKDTIVLPNMAVKNGSTDKVSVATPKWNLADWTDGGDGWLYYNKILPGSASGKTTDERQTNKLVGAVNFLSADDMNNLEDARYKDADYQLHFTMEIVQASSDQAVSKAAVKELFGRDIELPEDDDGWPENKYNYVIVWE